MIHQITKRDGSWKARGMKEYWDSLPDGSYTVEIKSSKHRSNDQNAYYWGVVVDTVYRGLKDAGFDAVRNKQDAHEVMKSLFLKQVEERDGIRIEKVRSTTELNTLEFAEYLMHIFTWGIDYLGITIPEPNQQLVFEL